MYWANLGQKKCRKIKKSHRSVIIDRAKSGSAISETFSSGVESNVDFKTCHSYWGWGGGDRYFQLLCILGIVRDKQVDGL